MISSNGCRRFRIRPSTVVLLLIGAFMWVPWFMYARTQIMARHQILGQIAAYESGTPNVLDGEGKVVAPDLLWLLGERGIKMIYVPDDPDAPKLDEVSRLFPEAIVLPMKNKPRKGNPRNE